MSWWVESRTLIGSFKLQPDATFFCWSLKFWSLKNILEILQLFSERKTRESRTCRWFSSKIPIFWSFGNWGFKLPPYLDAPLFDAVAEMLNPIAKGRGGESPNRKSFGSSSKNCILVAIGRRCFGLCSVCRSQRSTFFAGPVMGKNW